MLVTPYQSYAFSDGSGWAIYPYIVKMLYEAYKRYTQLQQMIQQSKSHLDYLRAVNAGLDNIMGIVSSLPVKDERVLEDLKNFKDAVQKVNDLYGAVPQSKESNIQLLHDDTIAESLKLTNSAKEYAEGQEANAIRAFQMAGQMSPKGAARLAASTNAQILHTLSQLLRVHGQMLKVQSEEFALSNKQEKDSVGRFNKVNADMKESLEKFQGDFELPRF
ncbi:MAG: hypothetical protein JST16_03790 [Bdellovibrionales bacterium]|nr:hypothetical protein [Bdellovibrionales bacterium]